jgi:hypothetical protein
VVWAGEHDGAKPGVIKGPSRKCGGCARRVAGLIPGGLCGCRWMLDRRLGADRRVGATVVAGRLLLAVEKSAEVVVPAGLIVRWEGPNAKPSVRTFVLVVVALTVASPCCGGLGGRAGG